MKCRQEQWAKDCVRVVAMDGTNCEEQLRTADTGWQDKYCRHNIVRKKLKIVLEDDL